MEVVVLKVMGREERKRSGGGLPQPGLRGGNVSARKLEGRSLAWRSVPACLRQPSPANPSLAPTGRVHPPSVLFGRRPGLLADTKETTKLSKLRSEAGCGSRGRQGRQWGRWAGSPDPRRGRRALAEGSSLWKRGPGAREGASGQGSIHGRLPSQGARIQLLARLPRVSHEGIEESPRTRGFSLPMSPLRPVHDSFAE